ncbi:MAG: hypothetical protein WBE68_13500 [Candidatus Nitrosopolaris sp.]
MRSLGTKEIDYVPHHEPFMYYNSTANPHHLPPTSIAMIGRTDQADHQYNNRTESAWCVQVHTGFVQELAFLDSQEEKFEFL